MSRRLLVVGFGRSGEWAARLALDRGQSVRVYDDADLAADGRLPEDIRSHPDFTLAGSEPLQDIDEMVLSPGVPPEHPLVREAENRGIPVVSEIAFAARYCTGRMIGITGSNGKTTVTECTAHVLRAAGFPGVACGNVGVPFSRIVMEKGPDNLFVLELSSFQLERARGFRPDVGALLNLSPDHLDRYPDVTAYYRAKIQFFSGFSADQVAVINGDDAATRPFLPEIRGRIETVGENGSLVRVLPDSIADAGGPIVSAGGLHIRGRHNLYNAGFAAALALLVGAEREAVAQGLRSFRPIAHRLEFIGERNGVRFFNDSKATNFDSVVKALESFDRIRWIAGGKYKGGDFSTLGEAGGGRVVSGYYIGDSGGRFARELAGYWPGRDWGTLEAALTAAWQDAQPGEVILLAPGCASFDQFENFEVRGDRFRELAWEVIGETNRD